MKIQLRFLFISAVTSSFLLCSQLASAQTRAPLPPALKALEKKGVHIVGKGLPAPKGMIGWAGYHGQDPLAFYVAADGSVIVGALMDAEGEDMTSAPLKAAVNAQMTSGIWKSLEKTHWIADGSDRAPRTVYVFTDPNCPYCNKLWSDARPWVDASKVQLRHVIVGILTPTSPAKAAALLADKNPAATLAAYERAQISTTAKGLASGHPRPLGDDGIKPMSTIPPAIQAQLDANVKLMINLGMQATPAVVWRDAKGIVQIRTGVPDQALSEIMGPR